MRTLCDVCEAAAARVFCAADEAALCPKCDEKVHGCNKLASRHVRLRLAEARAVPQCDICESAPAFFYCGVDGTSLCLQCDLNVHVGGKKTHERYLLTGQRVELPTIKVEDEFGKQSITEHSHKPLQKYHLSRLWETKQERNESSDTSAIAVAVGDTDPPPLAHQFISQMTDINSRLQYLQGEPFGASQSIRDTELANSSDEEIPGAVGDRSSRGKRPADG